MFFEIFKYDFRYRLKQPTTYVFIFTFFILSLLSLLSDSVNIGSIYTANLVKNAPYAIMSQVGFMSLFSLLVATAINNAAALRDFNSHFNEILFSSPIKRGGYLFGRFFSSVLLSTLPVVAVLLAFVVFKAVGNQEDVGPTYTAVYWQSLLVFILPNAFIYSAILFSLASLFRNGVVAFVTALILFMGYINIIVTVISNSENLHLLWVADPFGLALFNDLTKFWTVSDRESMWISLTGPMLWNRLIWMGIGTLLLAITYFRFSFQVKKKVAKKKNSVSKSPVLSQILTHFEELPAYSLQVGFDSMLRQFFTQFKADFRSIWRYNPFRILVAFGVGVVAINMGQADTWFGTGNHPATYLMISAIRNSMPVFILIIIGFYSGDLIWKERKAKMDQLLDATPISSWVPVTSKFLTMVCTVALLLVACAAIGILVQSGMGYNEFDLSQYFVELLLIDMGRYIPVIALAIFIHLIVNNLYMGFFTFMVLVLVNTFLWGALDVSSNLVIFAGVPDYEFSDMTRWLPFQKGIIGFIAYWLVSGLLLVVTNTLFANRGVGLSWKDRLSLAKLRFDKKARALTLVILLTWLGTGSLLYYETQVLNPTLTQTERLGLAADYERNYKQYENLPQPKIITAHY